MEVTVGVPIFIIMVSIVGVPIFRILYCTHLHHIVSSVADINSLAPSMKLNNPIPTSLHSASRIEPVKQYNY